MVEDPASPLALEDSNSRQAWGLQIQVRYEGSLAHWTVADAQNQTTPVLVVYCLLSCGLGDPLRCCALRVWQDIWPMALLFIWSVYYFLWRVGDLLSSRDSEACKQQEAASIQQMAYCWAVYGLYRTNRYFLGHSFLASDHAMLGWFRALVHLKFDFRHSEHSVPIGHADSPSEDWLW